MRERITAAFVVLTLLVVAGAGTVRAITLRDYLREGAVDHLHEHAALALMLVEREDASGRQVDQDFLSDLVGHANRLEYVAPEGRSIAVRGEDYPRDSDDVIAVTVASDAGEVTASEPELALLDIVGSDQGALFTLFLLIVLAAGFVGWLAARVLAAPFQKLAVAAGALGRGRFDLDLPRTRVPEAAAISASLRTSAHQLESRIRRERAFAEHASHVLRSPLTALRLELEEMTLRDDVPDDAKAAADRCIRSVDDVNRSAGELVAMARRGSLVEGAEVTLEELATQLAQHWADRLAEENRDLSASVEGDLTAVFTPGPVEQVLDLVLSDVSRSGKGPVRITFSAQDDHLRVRVPAGTITPGTRRRGPAPGAGLAAARTVAETQGGRVTGDGDTQDLEVLLPRR